jgi:hypothetical protein
VGGVDNSAPPMRSPSSPCLRGGMVFVAFITTEGQRTPMSIAATKTLVVSHGFAACCEEWLCLSVKLTLSPGLRPYFRG